MAVLMFSALRGGVVWGSWAVDISGCSVAQVALRYSFPAYMPQLGEVR